MDHLCYLCLVFVMLSRLSIAALWSPAGKGLTYWLSFVMFNCVFVTVLYGILGQEWCLIASIPNLCHLSYFYINAFLQATLEILQKVAPKMVCQYVLKIQRFDTILAHVPKCALQFAS